MPGMSGQELYRKISEIKPEAAGRVVFITGDASDAGIQAFLDKNGLTCITKPFSRRTLEEKVSEILSRA
jgi:CheY-like chemotaxis protein